MSVKFYLVWCPKKKKLQRIEEYEYEKQKRKEGVEQMAEAKQKDLGKKPKEKRMTISQFVKDVLRKDPEIPTDEAIQKIKKEFPKSRVSKTHISYYRSKFREELGLPHLHKTEKKVSKKKKVVVKAKKKVKLKS